MTMRMRFVEEYAVEWLRADGTTIQSEPTRSFEVAASAAEWLPRQKGIHMARVLNRTIRQEKKWWQVFWLDTGVTRWFDAEERFENPLVPIEEDGRFDAVDVN
ncbi:hypothetical protein SEA_MARIETTA_11 [Gordonia phage Marietta]|uniref:Uncharacterized protein n=2 Tax=Sukkupivirus TaxID=2948917 RepID=A0A385DPK7_9CAUD|nr:hypothetical protein KNU07_gp11 [Gordonia phage Marietta]YP_010104682.1 hypothetical protein KNU79_gp10 [Gordonia phage NadineRae]AXQ61331.1 hypothetical protein SEA_MARIETTA_11 [Gordonia phage Marietta]QAU06338.1 hypothetical protein SEA_WHOSEMANZ_11 [Gordonia phage WhoseManz]QFP97698.1 hypothetical protein SEA_NADINERAE_10 [Gordonia phage NadineRae]